MIKKLIVFVICLMTNVYAFSQNSTGGNKPPFTVTIKSDTLNCFTFKQTADIADSAVKLTFVQKELDLTKMENRTLNSIIAVKDEQLVTSKQENAKRQAEIDNQKSMLANDSTVIKNKDKELELAGVLTKAQEKKITSLKIQNIGLKILVAIAAGFFIQQSLFSK